MKKTIGIFTSLIIIFSLIAAIAVRNSFFKYSLLSNDMTLDKLQTVKILMDAYGAKDDWDGDLLKEFVEEQLLCAKEAACVVKVKPTNHVYINDSILMQEAKVTACVKGNCKDRLIWIASEGATITEDKYGNFILHQLDYSLMQNDCEYLAFITPLGSNAYSDKKVYFADENLWFSYFNLTRDSAQIMKDKYYHSDIEFYAQTKDILTSFQLAKDRIRKFYHQ